MINIDNGGYKLDEKIFKVVERFLGLKLPKAYRTFLLDVNGGKCSSNSFFISEKEGEDSIRYFFGINEDESYDLLSCIKRYKKRVPLNMLPIANDSFGNLILLSISDPDYGKVYFWDHDWEVEDGQIPDYSNLTLIADSFEEFLNSLKSEDEIE